MAITLTPHIDNLGIMAPVLGPWFSDTSISLGKVLPDNNLGLTLTFASATHWYAPATGLLSLFITDAVKPPAVLDALQDATGGYPFQSGRLLAYFRLLPEVEERLHALMGLVPAVTANPIGSTLPTTLATPSRPQVRSFALLLPSGVDLTPAALFPFFGGADAIDGDDDREKVIALGLALDGAGNLANSPLPMTWLRRPGGSSANRDRLLTGLTGDVELWAFDRRGRAIDPGAVACWWSWLLNTGVGVDPATSATDFQLLAPGIPSSDRPQQGGQTVVVQFAAQLTAHVVDAHEGPLGTPFINGRLQSGESDVSANLLQSTNSAISLSFSTLPAPDPTDPTPPPDNPQVDDAPRPRMSVLPTGSYGATASLWPGGPVHVGLTRDFVRVGVVEEESHLAGLTRRDSRETASDPSERRQSAQNRPSTRINVNRTASTAGVLLPNGQAVADAMLALPNVTSPTRWVLGIADVAWGGTPNAAAAGPTPSSGPLPVALNDAATAAPTEGEYRVRALAGGGALAENRQTVLLEVNIGAANAGAWVRAWPLGFDLTQGVHFRMSGGAGRADTNGLAVLTMLLINGQVAPVGLLGMDLLVVLPGSGGAVRARRHYADRRFTRPEPVGSTAATSVSGQWVICEAGVSGSGSIPNGSIPSGGHVVLLSDPPAVVDKTALPDAAWEINTLRNKLQASDIVSLTSPAYGATPDRADALGHPLPRTPTTGGSPAGGLDGIVGNKLHLLNRGALEGVTASSVPYALMDRLEVAAATAGASAATAVIGSASTVPWMLEPPTNDFLGFPGVPAEIEVHGTGVNLSGPPAVAVAEYVRERTAGLSFAAVQVLDDPVRSVAVQCELAVAAEAATALPTIAEGTGAGPVVAILRTSALGMEGVPSVADEAIANNIFPLSQNEAALEDWLNSNVTIADSAGSALRNAAHGPIDSMTRALDRRLLTSAFGAREALTALLAAIGRAQDLIYIETPGVDNLTVESDGELRLWQALIDRMDERKGLRVVLCVPTLLLPGTPRKVQEVRDQCLMDAVDTIREAAPDRFALFSPGVGAGRALRFASTSVIVDDAIAITGTTHLTRRGLTWDSSLAAAVFDEQLQDGRPQDVANFRIRLLADRLGIPMTRVPSDPAELVKAIRDLDTRGSERLSVTPILRPVNTPANADIDAFNPDGSASGLTLTSIAATFADKVALTDSEHAILEG